MYSKQQWFIRNRFKRWFLLHHETPCAGIFKQSMRARNRVGHSLVVWFLETILGLLNSLKIRAYACCYFCENNTFKQEIVKMIWFLTLGGTEMFLSSSLILGSCLERFLNSRTSSVTQGSKVCLHCNIFTKIFTIQKLYRGLCRTTLSLLLRFFSPNIH